MREAEAFPNEICRLINTSKSSIGEISKAILDTINKNVVRSAKIKSGKKWILYT